MRLTTSGEKETGRGEKSRSRDEKKTKQKKNITARATWREEGPKPAAAEPGPGRGHGAALPGLRSSPCCRGGCVAAR